MKIAIGAACSAFLALVFAVSARAQGTSLLSGGQVQSGPVEPAKKDPQRFFNTSYLGFIMGDEDPTRWSVSLQNISGIDFGELHQLGLGIGLDFYTPAGLVPLFMSYSIALPEKTVAPFLQVNLGYAPGWLRDDNNGFYRALDEGGPFFDTGTGCRIKAGNNAIRVMVGYRRQETRFSLNDFRWWGGTETIQKRVFNRATVKVGFEI